MLPTHSPLIARLLLVGYWTALFIATHVPTLPTGVERVSDKLLHYLAYCGLMFLLCLDQQIRGKLSLKWTGWLYLAVVVYAALDELLQIPVGRTADVRDWLADAIGAACGAVLFAIGRWGWRRMSGGGDYSKP